MGHIIDDEGFMLQVMCNLHQEYDTVVEICEEEIAKGTQTIKSLRQKLCAKYKRMQKRVDRETGISSQDNRINNNKKIRSKECKNCGKRGHTISDCFLLPQNKEQFE